MSTDPRARFPRSARVRLRVEYTRVFEGGRRLGDSLLGLHWLPGDGEPRLGLAVSRKVDPRAVGRNRIKRVLRESMRHHRATLAGGDYVVVARPAARHATGVQVEQSFLRLLRKAGALPAPARGGTMPAPSPSDSMPDLPSG